jgi:hypothetical protein
LILEPSSRGTCGFEIKKKSLSIDRDRGHHINLIWQGYASLTQATVARWF